MAIVELELTRGRTLTAAAVTLDGIKSKELERQIKRHEAWQIDASGYFSEIGEIHYVVNRAASALSEATLYAATTSEAGQLVPVDAPESLVSPSVAQAAIDELAKLRAPVGGQAQLVHQAYVNTEIAGEWFLVETVDDDGNPAWWVRSVLETKIQDRAATVVGVGEVPFDQISRVWRPHPMRFEAADSGMRPILGACELVLLIDRHFRASLRSRLFAGLLLMPNGLRDGERDQAQKGDPQADQVVDDILDALTLGIQEEGSASAVVPNAVYGSLEDIGAVRLVEFAQQVDPEVLKLRESSIQRIVQGLEYPPEVVTGTADVSHWGAWFIGDSFVDHVRPKGDFLADAFTTVFLRPGLIAAGVDPVAAGEVVLAFDYTPLMRRPNVVETATLAHDRFVISDESLRRDLGYDDDDAPDPVEVAERVARRATQRRDEPGVSTGPPADAVTASVPSRTLGGQLVELDIALSERLFAATLAVLRRALERAGNRAKSRVASAHRDGLRGVPATNVCAHLGPALLAAANLTEDELLEDALDRLERDWFNWTSEAAAAAFALSVGDAVLADDVVDALSTQRAAGVERGWEWFAVALRGLMSRRLAEGGEPGEAEVRALVRQALAAAGGVTELGGGAAVPSTAATGVATGPYVAEALGAAGQEVAGWRWVHDDPAHPFPPHVALDGAEAATAEEFGIGFGGWPGDHAGCLCVLEPLVRRVDDE